MKVLMESMEHSAASRELVKQFRSPFDNTHRNIMSHSHPHTQSQRHPQPHQHLQPHLQPHPQPHPHYKEYNNYEEVDDINWDVRPDQIASSTSEAMVS